MNGLMDKRSLGRACVAAIFSMVVSLFAPFANFALAEGAGRIDEPADTVEISIGDTGNPVGPRVDVDEPTGKWTKTSPNAKKAYVWSKATTVSAARATSSVFKDNFTAQSIAINAGAAFASKLYDQYKSGKKLDAVEAAKFIVSRESLCSFAGAAIGATGGTALGTFIATGVPVVGPALGAMMPVFFSLAGSTMGTKMGRDMDNGKPTSFKKAWAAIDKGDLIGRTIGATIGMAVGNMLLPGLGGFIGSVAGNLIGSKVVGLVRKLNEKIRGARTARADEGRTAGAANGDGANAAAAAAAGVQDAPAFGGEPAGLAGAASAASDGAGSDALKKASDAKIAAYHAYVGLVNQGKGDSAEAKTAMENFLRASQECDRAAAEAGAAK